MSSETLGQVFRRYRKEEGIKVFKIEQDLKISKKVILALESDDYKNLPDDLYVKNFIKSYADYLSLDYNKLLNLYEQTKKDQSTISGQEKQGQKQNKPKKVRAFLTPRMIRNFIIALIVISLLTYISFQVKKIFNPPNLEVTNPVQDIIIEDDFINISGQTEKEAQVFVNEKEVFLDSDGKFEIELDLQKGLNLIKISARKRHGGEAVVYREILVQ